MALFMKSYPSSPSGGLFTHFIDTVPSDVHVVVCLLHKDYGNELIIFDRYEIYD